MTPNEQARVQRLTGNSPPGRLFNGDTKVGGALFLARNVFVESGVTLPPKPPLKLGDGEREDRSDISHDLHTMPTKSRVKTFGLYSTKGITAHYLGMSEFDVWPKRTVYRARLEAYLKETGQTQEDFANGLGISLSHLRNSMYREEKRLGLEILQKSCAMFKCSILEFVDDPGAPISGQDMSSSSEQARFFASLITKDVAAEDLTDDERRYLYEDHIRALEGKIALGPGRITAVSPGPVPCVLLAKNKDADWALDTVQVILSAKGGA